MLSFFQNIEVQIYSFQKAFIQAFHCQKVSHIVVERYSRLFQQSAPQTQQELYNWINKSNQAIEQWVYSSDFYSEWNNLSPQKKEWLLYFSRASFTLLYRTAQQEINYSFNLYNLWCSLESSYQETEKNRVVNPYFAPENWPSQRKSIQSRLELTRSLKGFIKEFFPSLQIEIPVSTDKQEALALWLSLLKRYLPPNYIIYYLEWELPLETQKELIVSMVRLSTDKNSINPLLKTAQFIEQERELKQVEFQELMFN